MLERRHLNTDFSIALMDDITNRVNRGWRPDDLAGWLGISAPRVVAMLQRNGLAVHHRRKRKGDVE